MVISVFALACALAACAPTVDTALTRQRAVDREDSARLAAQLGALPGVVRSDVVLQRAVNDPLGASAPAAASAVLIVDDRADRAALTAAARALARALVPGAEPAIVVEVGAIRPVLAHVGPFAVEAAGKTRLKVTLAIAFALIALLAGYIAWSALRQRPRE